MIIASGLAAQGAPPAVRPGQLVEIRGSTPQVLARRLLAQKAVVGQLEDPLGPEAQAPAALEQQNIRAVMEVRREPSTAVPVQVALEDRMAMAPTEPMVVDRTQVVRAVVVQVEVQVEIFHPERLEALVGTTPVVQVEVPAEHQEMSAALGLRAVAAVAGAKVVRAAKVVGVQNGTLAMARAAGVELVARVERQVPVVPVVFTAAAVPVAACRVQILVKPDLELRALSSSLTHQQ